MFYDLNVSIKFEVTKLELVWFDFGMPLKRIDDIDHRDMNLFKLNLANWVEQTSQALGKFS